MMIEPNNIYLGDCLDLMKQIPDKSVDMILCDLPYGTTACKWDIIIPFDKLWTEYNRVAKTNAAILLFGKEPFSSHLRISNIKKYRYDWVWRKSNASNFRQFKNQPQQIHENISVFYDNLPTYNPQMEKTDRVSVKNKGKKYDSELFGVKMDKFEYKETGFRYPYSVQFFENQSGEMNNRIRFHPTQKPVRLLEYLILTYTNKDNLVLDNCAGSGSTLVAAKNLNRQFIGMEREEKYFNIAKERLEKNG